MIATIVGYICGGLVSGAVILAALTVLGVEGLFNVAVALLILAIVVYFCALIIDEAKK